MATAFTRQLGAEAGVQLNPLRDDSEIFTLDNYDQVFGIMMRATRGRIDKPFKVNRGDVLSKLGKGEQIRTSALNEAWVHVVEALNNGAYEAVVQRLSVPEAVISYAGAYVGSGVEFGSIIVSAGEVISVAITTGGTGYITGQAVTFAGAGTGAAGTIVATAGIITSVVITAPGTGYTVAPTATVVTPGYAVSATTPATPYLFSIKHLGCHNDGIKVDFRAEEKRSGGIQVANDRITVRIKDSTDIVLFEFYGSLDPTALDDYGNSAFLPDVVSAQTDAVEVTVGATTSIATTSSAYGYDANGQPRWAKSATLVCFSEGGTAYVTSDYSAARAKLQITPFNYAYISSGGSQSAAVLAQLVQLAFDTNRQLRLDIPGSLTPDAAITFIEALNLDGNENTSHLVHAFWTPLKSNDPTGINGKGYLGSATLNIAYACGRNAQTNAKGFAPKNYVVAGRKWPLNRMNITQTYTPNDQELNALARAKINPVIFETYTGGGLYVFRDSLTSAAVESSLKKLISVADMSTSIDEAVTRFGKDVLQLPMDVAIRRTSDFLKRLFEDAQSSGWLVPSSDPTMNGSAFRYDVKANAVRPYDRMDINYWLRYDGTVRQIFVTQTLSK
ncbi:MAG: hypothetical protein WC856_02495 [Methylococcaceae bacterium]|jgi:hypothetical protein